MIDIMTDEMHKISVENFEYNSFEILFWEEWTSIVCEFEIETTAHETIMFKFKCIKALDEDEETIEDYDMSKHVPVILEKIQNDSCVLGALNEYRENLTNGRMVNFGISYEFECSEY